jgi:hypothetical protein
MLVLLMKIEVISITMRTTMKRNRKIHGRQKQIIMNMKMKMTAKTQMIAVEEEAEVVVVGVMSWHSLQQQMDPTLKTYLPKSLQKNNKNSRKKRPSTVIWRNRKSSTRKVRKNFLP